MRTMRGGDEEGKNANPSKKEARIQHGGLPPNALQSLRLQAGVYCCCSLHACPDVLTIKQTFMSRLKEKQQTFH